jgi:hypothetical protein
VRKHEWYYKYSAKHKSDFSLINTSAIFKESSLGGGAKQEKWQNEKYEPSRFGERASLKRDFVKL